jgi:hypothetical protein
MLTTGVIQGTGDKGRPPPHGVWRGIKDLPPKLAWPAEEDVEVEEYTLAPRDQDHQHEVRRQVPGGSGEGEYQVATACRTSSQLKDLCVVFV